MSIVQHEFTNTIIAILNSYFPDRGNKLFNHSELLQYLNIKTKAANRGSKSRAGLANQSKAFNEFMSYCQEMIAIQQQEPGRAIEFIRGLLKPNVDARVFEIVSYAILKEYYNEQQIYWGWSLDELNVEYLVLYKTGRTNANDGGIDFVMKPLGRFFQVTETIDAGKYFLDIDKVQRYPITFVVKTEQPVINILEKLEEQATTRYQVKAIVRRYMESVEEVINIPELMRRFDVVLERNRGAEVIAEIVLQSRVEFNVQAEEQDVLAYEDAGEDEVG